MGDGEVTVPSGADLGSRHYRSLSSLRVREERDVTCAKLSAQHVPRGGPRIAFRAARGRGPVAVPSWEAVSVEVSPWDPQMGEHAITLTPPPRGGSFGKLMLRF